MCRASKSDVVADDAVDDDADASDECLFCDCSACGVVVRCRPPDRRSHSSKRANHRRSDRIRGCERAWMYEKGYLNDL